MSIRNNWLRKNLYKKFRNKISQLARKSAKNAFYDQTRLLSTSQALNICDVGANLGSVTAKYRRLFPNANIYSFEPFPRTFERLAQRFKSDAKIHVNEMALSNSIREAELFVSGSHDMNSLIPPILDKAWGFSPELPKIKVQTETLDTYCRQAELSDIHILKIDVQGGEIQLLEGADELLLQSKIWLIYTEVLVTPLYESQPLFHDIALFLQQYAYTLFNIYHLQESKLGQLRWGDAIFISPRLKQQLLEKHGATYCGW